MTSKCQSFGGQHPCGCGGNQSGVSPEFQSIPEALYRGLEQDNQQYAKKSTINKQFHITPHHGFLYTSVNESFQNDPVTSFLVGSIAYVPFKLTLEFNWNSSPLEVTLYLDEPIPLTHRWQFHMTSAGVMLAHSESGASDEDKKRIDWWCVAKCGGAAIATCLMKCLPAIPDPAVTFPACVATCAGWGSVGVAYCIATKCIKSPDADEE